MIYLVYCDESEKEMIVECSSYVEAIELCINNYDDGNHYDPVGLYGIPETSMFTENDCGDMTYYPYNLNDKKDLILCILNGNGMCIETFQEIKNALRKHGLLCEYKYWAKRDVGMDSIFVTDVFDDDFGNWDGPCLFTEDEVIAP